MDDYTDIELVDLAWSGDARAWQALFDRHYPMVHRLAFRWCGSGQDAEDVAQEVFVKLVSKLGSYRRRSSFRTWLYRVAVNTARDFGRRSSLRQSRHEPLESGHRGDNPASPPRDGVSASWIESALEKLPAPQKEAVLLVLVEGMSHREAAEVLGCVEATVSWRIFRAQRTLRALLGDSP